MTGFYKYFDSIKMNDLTISTFEERIELTNYTRRKRSSIIQEQYKFTLETPDDSIKQNWIKTIEDILWDQLNKQRGEIFYIKYIFRRTRACQITLTRPFLYRAIF